MTFHLLTGEFPPERGGVGDYTELVARALAARGCLVHVWCPSAAAEIDGGAIRVHALPDRFGAASRRRLAEAIESAPGCILLEYVPNALGARGANLRFCAWLWRLRTSGRRDVRVMFHEPYFYFGWQSPALNGLALVQRLMAAVLLRASARTYLSTETWTRYLALWAPGAAASMTPLPVPSTVPADADAAAVRSRRRELAGDQGLVVGHFGTFGDHLDRELRAAIPAILRADRRVRFVCIGRGSGTFASSLAAVCPDAAGRVTATGELAGPAIAAALRACDVVVQPYPDGVTTRRTSVMAPLANGVATVTTSGPLTEPVWASTGAVALAPASNAEAIAGATAALLADAPAREALGRRGRQVYAEQFSIERTVDTLLCA